MWIIEDIYTNCFNFKYRSKSIWKSHNNIKLLLSVGYKRDTTKVKQSKLILYKIYLIFNIINFSLKSKTSYLYYNYLCYDNIVIFFINNQHRRVNILWNSFIYLSQCKPFSNKLKLYLIIAYLFNIIILKNILNMFIYLWTCRLIHLL